MQNSLGHSDKHKVEVSLFTTPTPSGCRLYLPESRKGSVRSRHPTAHLTLTCLILFLENIITLFLELKPLLFPPSNLFPCTHCHPLSNSWPLFLQLKFRKCYVLINPCTLLQQLHGKRVPSDCFLQWKERSLEHRRLPVKWGILELRACGCQPG